jgi:sulfur relay (sulfurtransferase) complex TusBCD TusD component (DsrE family)
MEKFVFVVFKGLGDSGAAIRAIALASKAAVKGHHVEVFLMDDAVVWAQLGMGEWVYAVTGEHMKDLLDILIENKTPIHLCKACADKRLLSEDECIAGSVISESAALVDMMTNPEYKVFTF